MRIVVIFAVVVLAFLLFPIFRKIYKIQKLKQMCIPRLDKIRDELLNSTIIADSDMCSEAEILKDLVNEQLIKSNLEECFNQNNIDHTSKNLIITSLVDQMRSQVSSNIDRYHIDSRMIKDHIPEWSKISNPIYLSEGYVIRYVVIPTKLEKNDYQKYRTKAYQLELDRGNYIQNLIDKSSPDQELLNEYDARISLYRDEAQKELEKLLFDIKSSLNLSTIEKDGQTTINAWEKLMEDG